jgi:transcriptional regulator with XRE-family HTH domain
VSSGELLREARLRAGLSQAELGERVSLPRSQIARWERDVVKPSLETLQRLVEACGYQLPLRLEPLAQRDDTTLETLRRLTPQERLTRALHAAPADSDPLALLDALDRHRVDYLISGELAAIIHGADRPYTALTITPHLRGDAPQRLTAALTTLAAKTPTTLDEHTPTETHTRAGTLVIDPTPPGTRGFADLRRASTREPLGQGLRPRVTAPADLIRTLNTQPDPDRDLLDQLHRIANLERTHSRGLSR